MFKIISSKRLQVLICSMVLMCLASASLAQDKPLPFVRLATYWDAPGEVKTISADDRWIVIYDRNGNTSRLVEVATGKVQATSVADTGIRFSPKGRFATINIVDTETVQIIDLDTK